MADKRLQRKRKREAANDTGKDQKCSNAIQEGRQYTVSIAVPGSIIDNAQNLELKTYLAGQIARAAAIFNVDEIVVFDETGSLADSKLKANHSDPNIFLCRLLQYLETPQYLRRALFPMHHDLKFAGLLNPLDSPHHMRQDEETLYREGVVLDQPVKAKEKGKGSYINCGLKNSVKVTKKLKAGVRVTVKMNMPYEPTAKHNKGEVVPPSLPRTASGLYWGYTVRLAHSLSAVLTQAPYEGGYDMIIGTSDKGTPVDTLTSLSPFKHCLILFGGLRGLEYSLESDESLDVHDMSLLCQYYLNTCPAQGSRTIRTEEALLISLASLRPLVAVVK